MSDRRLVGTFLLAGVAVWALLPVQGQDAKPAPEPLEPIAWMVGGKWVTELKATDGNSLTVETTCQWAGHHKAIQYAIVFKTRDKTMTQYEGTYYWHPGKKRIALLQLDAQGNVTESTLTSEGGMLKQENDVVLADGSMRKQRVDITRDGNDIFHMQALVPKDGDWVKAAAFQYKRVR